MDILNKSVKRTILLPALFSYIYFSVTLSRRYWVLVISLCFLFQSCAVPVEEVEEISLTGDDEYSLPGASEAEQLGYDWWKTFGDSHLNSLMEEGLEQNLSIQQSFARLDQAAALERQARSAEIPPIEFNYGYSVDKEAGSESKSGWESDLSLAWEIDLWGRLGHGRKAAQLSAEAALEDTRDVRLLVSFEIAKNYFGLVEQRLQQDLLEKQIEINKTYLDLTKLRFANGAASVVDVYQQKQLLGGNEAKRILVLEQIVSLENRLHVLTGQMPAQSKLSIGSAMPSLSPLPYLGIPADLLLNRPDLRSLHARLEASYFKVSQAIAGRLPQVRIGGGVGLSDGFFFHNLFADAFAAVIDWGARKSEVERQDAVARELVNLYTETYLKAVEEVENCLWREKYHQSFLENLKNRLAIAESNLKETRNRYMQGLTDYLPVLTSLLTWQNLENEFLDRQLELIENRLTLYKALGGPVPEKNSDLTSSASSQDQQDIQQ